MTIKNEMMTTAFEIPGYETKENLGIVRGIIVRSRSIVGTIGGGIQTLFGGDITLFTSLCEQARKDAFLEMSKSAEKLGANAIVGVRYDATGIGSGVTEVLAYGTAVRVEKKA